MWKKIFGGLVLTGLVLIAGAFFYVTFSQETEELDEKRRSEIGGTFIQLSQGFVHYELAGPDTGASVILVHGAGSGSYAWDNNFAALAKNGFRVLRYDLY